jgi:hypothetical protein
MPIVLRGSAASVFYERGALVVTPQAGDRLTAGVPRSSDTGPSWDPMPEPYGSPEGGGGVLVSEVPLHARVGRFRSGLVGWFRVRRKGLRVWGESLTTSRFDHFGVGGGGGGERVFDVAFVREGAVALSCPGSGFRVRGVG